MEKTTKVSRAFLHSEIDQGQMFLSMQNGIPTGLTYLGSITTHIAEAGRELHTTLAELWYSPFLFHGRGYHWTPG